MPAFAVPLGTSIILNAFLCCPQDAAKAIAAAVAALDDARGAYAVVEPVQRARLRDAVEAELVAPYEVGGGGGARRETHSLVVRRGSALPMPSFPLSLQALCARDDAAARSLRHPPTAVRAMLTDFLELRDDRDGGGGAGLRSVSFKRR